MIVVATGFLCLFSLVGLSFYGLPSFYELHAWVCALPGFADEPNRSGEKILEAIQMMWIDEAE